MKNKSCFYSSFFFIINTMIAYYYKYYDYSFAFLYLTLTSLYHHYYSTKITRNLDRIAILLMLFYTITIFHKKFKNNNINLIHIIIYGIIYSIIMYLYLYGYFTKQYCFNLDPKIACLWHSLIHFIIAVSHIILILL